jgi:hypothetical protein
MPVFINIKPYLAELERNQTSKPEPDRLKVPTLADIARHLDMNEKHFLRIANNKIKRLDLEKLDGIIEFMRERGFNTDVPDLLIYKPRDQIE